MPDESGPKPKKRLTAQEARLQLVQEAQLSAFQKIFRELEDLEPKVAQAIKPSYNEFINTFLEVIKDHPKGDVVIFNEIKKRIPRNVWFVYLKARLEAKLSEPPREEISENVKRQLINDIRKRMKGEDIH